MMKKTFEQMLRDYAELAVKVGVNLQAGQRLMVRAPIESAPFVREIARVAYQVGSPLVSVIYHDEQLSKTRFEHAPEGTFECYPEWEASALLECARRGDAFIRVAASDPDLLKDQNPDDVAAATRSAQRHLSEWSKYPMSDRVAWLVASVPVPAWAMKVFPGHDAETATDMLWGSIFEACRVDLENPVEAWQQHLENLKIWSDYLNGKCFDALHFKGNGTNLVLGLPKGHIWKSGQSVAESGVEFVANLPTEEVFTMGDRNRADGVVRSSKPLNYAGTVIDEFTLRFAEGRVVEATARSGEATLKKLLETDEGAARIGEIALVPHQSPISQSNKLFYNTLFDENAASHLALGRAYRFNLKDGVPMSDESFKEAGGNDSLVHVDFMIGNASMDVDGLSSDGNREPVMRNGEWAFET